MNRILLGVVLAFAFILPAKADELTPAKRADLERLLEMTGALSIGKQMAGAVVGHLAQSVKRANPDIPQAVIDMLPGEVMAVFEENIATLKEEMIILHSRHFSAEEIKGLLAFYASPLGQKSIKALPAMAQEGMQIGQRWGQSLGPQIEKRVKGKLQQQGYKI